MQICTFASGSSGNCALVSSGNTHILIDAGISMRRVKNDLSALGLLPEQLDGVLVTHEHSDHVSGLAMMTKHWQVPIFAPNLTAMHLHAMLPNADIRMTAPGEHFDIGNISVTAFPTMHDADGSVGFRMDADVSFSFCTDLGCVTDEVKDCIQGVDGAMIEANHDVDMLRSGPYPYPLKRRILSDHGHLSNDTCGQLACFLAENGARLVILGHLSRENNRPEIAESAVRRALEAEGYQPKLMVAPASEMLRVSLEGTYAGDKAHLCGQS